MKQQNLFQLSKVQLESGGSLSKKGKRKSKRPLNAKQPHHLVLRSQQSTLLKKFVFIEYYLEKHSQRFQVIIYRRAICSNHIHLLVRFKSREDYQRFIRALSGSLAKVLKIKWSLSPYVKILSWGREFRSAQSYVAQNLLEAFGAIAYKPRKTRYGP